MPDGFRLQDHAGYSCTQQAFGCFSSMAPLRAKPLSRQAKTPLCWCRAVIIQPSFSNPVSLDFGPGQPASMQVIVPPYLSGRHGQQQAHTCNVVQLLGVSHSSLSILLDLPWRQHKVLCRYCCSSCQPAADRLHINTQLTRRCTVN